jgi:hypothetical protein
MPGLPATPSGSVSAQANAAADAITSAHFLADVYTFDWSALNFRLPAVSAFAVALCLFVGVAVGNPVAGLIAGGGALPIGFGANQRISDSRLLPMILAILAMASATFAGTVAGHDSWWLIVVSGISAAIYGVLTIRHAGMAWVGQQASVALFVASAFPDSLRGGLERAGLTMLGGMLQLLFTSAGLRMMPELHKDLLSIPRSIFTTLYAQRRELLLRLRQLPEALPAPDRKAAAIYGLRLLLTVGLASWVYLELGMQSGYWVPMTALLVQKPAFFETLGRALTRVAGTIAGASLATLMAAHLPMGPWWLAGLATFFAFWCFATISVNYGLYAVGITSYIVFLLALNQVPEPEIAARRAGCTIAGAVIALAIHVDALGRIRRVFWRGAKRAADAGG